MKELSQSPEIVKKIFCRGDGDVVKNVQKEPENKEKKIKPVKESLNLNQLKKTTNSTNLQENHYWVKNIFIHLVLFLFTLGMLFWLETENVLQIIDAIKNVWCKTPVIVKPIVSKSYFEKIVFYFWHFMKKIVNV